MCRLDYQRASADVLGQNVHRRKRFSFLNCGTLSFEFVGLVALWCLRYEFDQGTFFFFLLTTF